jgi:tripartite-type tricarboxylate transporter receptor subunit TctC
MLNLTRRVAIAAALTSAAAAVALTIAAAPTMAADAYPAKQIRIVVPFTPGGGTDFMARLIATKLSVAFGQQVIVDNRPGAGGVIGTDIVAKAPPDGYTLLLGSVSTISINPSLYRSLPYDTVRDLAPVGLFSVTPAALVVQLDLPVTSVGDLINLARAKPGQINFASAGNGTSHQLSGEMFKHMAGIDIVHVPYKGSAPAVTGMLSGEAQMMFADIPAVFSMIKGGKLRGLGVTSLHRSAVLHDLPTIAEAGLPGFEVLVWYGLLAPARTPAPIIERLNRELTIMSAGKDLRAQLEHEGAEAPGGTPAEFAALIDKEIAKWAMVVKTANVRLD